MSAKRKEGLNKACPAEMELGHFLNGGPVERLEIPRTDEYEGEFQRWLQSNGFNEYGEIDDQKLSQFVNKDGRFCNGTFAVFPYYWGDEERLIRTPNFEYIPKKVRVFWYKYPMRDASISKNLSPEEFHKMLEDCTSSLHKQVKAK